MLTKALAIKLRACFRRKIALNIKGGPRNRKTIKRGCKRLFDKKIHQRKFISERFFAWIDSLNKIDTF